MYQDTAAELVRHLAHPNGWWRDTAQKLLVLRQDKSVVPGLQTMARGEGNPLARIHALWTLEGLQALEAGLVRELMKSPDPQLRIQAIRASESLFKAKDASLAADYKALLEDGDPNVVIQAMLTLRLHRVAGHEEMIRAASSAASARGVQEIGRQLLTSQTFQGQPPAWSDPGAGLLGLPTEQRRVMQRGEAAYREVCAACHAADGTGAPMAGAAAGAKLAPPLAGSPRVIGHREYIVKVLLHGLTGPIGDVEYPGGVMVPMGTNTDEWIADVASYVRNSFGNRASFVTPAHVALVRKVWPRKTPWTLPDLDASLPRPLENRAQWKLSASHNAEAAAKAVAGTPGERWDTGGVAQQPGMWFQIELPQPTSIAEVQIDAMLPGQRGFGGRGGRGGGGPALGPVAYAVQVSMDGTSWSDPVAQGPGSTPSTAIAFAPVRARFIRITQTGTAAKTEQWGIAQVQVFEAGR
jgi:mono/diheme cytochrome c family protein